MCVDAANCDGNCSECAARRRLDPNPPVVCSCGREAEPYYEEVDIGVGVQLFLTGWECHEHGGICGVCNSCGVADRIGYAHRTWCREHPGEIITEKSFAAETDALRDSVVERFK
jgi:hypothetical protein